MRFSETLRFNANPDWWVYYIPYDDLKVQVAHLRELHSAVFFSSAAAKKKPSSRSSPSDGGGGGDESSDEERDVEAPAARPPKVPQMRRSASRKVLADMRAQSNSGNFTSTPASLHSHGALADMRVQPHPGYGAALEGLLATPIPTKELPVVENTTVDDAKRRFEEKDTYFFDTLKIHGKIVDEFYKRLCSELRQITDGIQIDASRFTPQRDHDETSGLVEGTPLLIPSSPSYAMNIETTMENLRTLRTRLVEHYKELGETVTFAALNKAGFDKILKKHDKNTGATSRARFMSNLLEEKAFADTAELESMQARTETMFAEVFRGGNALAGKEELRESLRDLIVWDRNTIWRDVLRTERKVSAFHAVKGGENLPLDGVRESPHGFKIVPVLVALIAFILILCFPGILNTLASGREKEYSKEILNAAHRCLAIVAGVVILWASEGVPLYVSSFLVLPAVVVLRVFIDDTTQKPYSSHDTALAVYGKLGSSTVLLIICVYALGAALSKYEIDKLAATLILSRIRKPGVLLLTLMCLAVFVSIFVSNVAAPVLLNSVMMPTIDAMRLSTSNRVYVRCLLLGIMIGSNIGGFASPIASPQAAFALGLLTGEHKISFGTWLLAAIPLCSVAVLACFIAMYIWYKPQRFVLPPLPRCSEALKWPHWVIIVTISITILLWSDQALQHMFGSAGIVAVFPLLIFFGSGILKKEDFNNLPWDVVYLVAGGSVLGAAVQSCKLLDLVAGSLSQSLGGNLIWTYVTFAVFMAVVANAVSHTVSAIIVLPLIYHVGMELDHPQLLVLAGTFAASSAMALPISSFPNISATQLCDEKGEPYLTSGEVLRVGSVMTALATLVLLTFGFFEMHWLLD